MTSATATDEPPSSVTVQVTGSFNSWPVTGLNTGVMTVTR